MRVALFALLLLTGCATPPRAELSVEYRVEQEQPQLVAQGKVIVQ